MYTRLLLRAFNTGSRPSERIRNASAWIDQAYADADSSLSCANDAEKLFTNEYVQQLLTELTGMDLEEKVFKTRRTEIQQRSHFALMTEARLAQTMDKMRAEAQRFLNFVPLKEPRSREVTLLSNDLEIIGFDNSKFVFTDITFDATDQPQLYFSRIAAPSSSLSPLTKHGSSTMTVVVAGDEDDSVIPLEENTD